MQRLINYGWQQIANGHWVHRKMCGEYTTQYALKIVASWEKQGYIDE